MSLSSLGWILPGSQADPDGVLIRARVQHFIHIMAIDDVIFTVHYGVRFNRRYKCTYVGGKIGVFDEPYDLDCLSFIEIETIVKRFRYQLGDLIYYLQPDKELDDGLVLLTCDDDIVRMSEIFIGHKVVVLYTVAFGHGNEEVCANDEDEPCDDDERRMAVINDLFWKSLISSDDDAWDDKAEPGVSTSTFGEEDGEDDGEDGEEDDGAKGDGEDEDADEEDVEEEDGDAEVGDYGDGDGDGDEDMDGDYGDGDEHSESTDRKPRNFLEDHKSTRNTPKQTLKF
ncbi:histone chaperone cia1-like [Corylus avellana]|uniref:histone chaperone cia1-like n=1 Tax=Corylus avellana TaxID=13451 RepID=UPI00286C4C8C|nr:histone chaperone cia1-like [Corylus avellana]